MCQSDPDFAFDLTQGSEVSVTVFLKSVRESADGISLCSQSSCHRSSLSEATHSYFYMSPGTLRSHCHSVQETTTSTASPTYCSPFTTRQQHPVVGSSQARGKQDIKSVYSKMCLATRTLKVAGKTREGGVLKWVKARAGKC